MDDDTANAQDARVEALWRTLDTGKEGRLDLKALKKGLAKMDHPLKNADALLRDVMKAVDTNGDGRITYNEFSKFVKETEHELYTLFKSIDRNDDGKLDKQELQAAFSRNRLTVPNSKLDQFFAEVDTNRDGVITFDEWRDFLLFIPENAPNLSNILSYFSSTVRLSPEGDVIISDETVHGLGTTTKNFLNSVLHILFGSIMGIVKPSPAPRRSVAVKAYTTPIPTIIGDGGPSQAPRPVQKSLDNLPSISSLQISDLPPDVAQTTDWMKWENLKPELIACVPGSGYFLAGALAGVASRTTTAPLDRLKVYLIAQTGVAKKNAVVAAKSGAPLQAVRHAWTPLVDASKELWKAGGLRSLFAGNGINIVKVMPESAVKFGAFEAAKRMLAKSEGHDDPKKITSVHKFLAGGMGGMISQFVVYPLDTLKFRMQCETVAGGLRGNALIFATAKKMWRSGGIRPFYSGLPMGLVGIFPYAAIDLGTFEYTKRRLTQYLARKRGVHEEQAQLGNFTTAAIGAGSGALGASLVYPLNLLRTRLQSQGTVQHPRTYTGITDVMRQTIQGEGVRGLFRGLTPNLLKVMPAVSITYVVYENSTRLMNLA